MGRLKLQQIAKMDIAGAGEISGRVVFVSPDLNPATQQGKARVQLGNDPKLRIGAFGKATIDMGQSCGVTIPFSSVLYSGEGAGRAGRAQQSGGDTARHARPAVCR